MRGLGKFPLGGAVVALSAASFASPLASHLAPPGPIILGGGGGETDEDRRRRNLAAGGRDKRIKRDKAHRSLRRARRSRYVPLALGRVFKSRNREAAFKAALADGKSRNEALKIGRRTAA